MAALDLFIALRNYVKNKVNNFELEDSDELITGVRERQNRGESEIKVEFDSEEDFLSAIGISDEDSWFYRIIHSAYDNWEFVDYYSAVEDFKSGYGLYFILDEENIGKLSQISKMILPMKVDFDSGEFTSELSEKLLTNFRSETENIISDYQTERNYESSSSARNLTHKELKEFLEEHGFQLYGNGFKTTVGNLVMLYLKDNKINLTLKELIEDIADKDNAPRGWTDDYYRYLNDDNFDKISFNNYTSKKLDDILEKLEDSADKEGFSIEEFTKMTDRITKKFEIGTYYNLPKDPKKNIRFKIEGFSFPDPKVTIMLQKGLKQKKISLSEDNFYSLLYQPTLFNLEEI